MKYINLLYISLFVLLVAGCYDDRGNYDYKTINEFEITSFNGSTSRFYTFTIDEEIRFTADLTFKRFEESDLSYEWYGDDSLISTAKELVFPAKELKNVKNEKTRSYVKLKVTSNTSGMIQFKGLEVDVTPIYFRGFVVLTEQNNGENKLHFLLNNWNGNQLTDVRVVRDVYAQQNSGESLGKNVVRLRSHCCFDYNYSENILVVRNDFPYTLDLSGGYLTKYVHTANFFLDNKLPTNYSPVDEISLFNYSYILNKDGKMYSRQKNSNREFQSGVYSNAPSNLYSPSSFPQDMEISKIFIGAPNYNAYAFLYDKKYQRILCASNDGRILYPFPLDAQDKFPEEIPLLHDLKGEMLYIGRTSGKLKSDYTFIFKDNNGIKLFKIFVNLNITNGSIYTSKLENPRLYSFDNSPLTSNSIFVQPTRTGDALFFSGGEDNKTLYCYTFETQKTIAYAVFDHSITTITCEEYHDVASNTTDNRTLAIGLESGEIKIIDIRYEAQHESNKDKRILQTVPLNNGKIKDIVCKVGFPYYAQ